MLAAPVRSGLQAHGMSRHAYSRHEISHKSPCALPTTMQSTDALEETPLNTPWISTESAVCCKGTRGTY
eukprot:3868539-Amphidinium_carterae.1